MKMAGFHEVMHRPRIDIETYIKRNCIELQIWSTPKVFHLFIHFCLEVKNHKRTTSDYFIPNHDDNNSYLIPSSVAIQITESCLQAFGMTPSKSKELSQTIPDMAEKDLFRRMLMK
jgi:hypothetical protein